MSTKLVVVVRVLEAVVLLAIGFGPMLCLDAIYLLFGWTPWKQWVAVRVEDQERGNCAVIMALLLLGVVVLIGLAGFMGGNDVWAVLQGLYKGSVGG